MSSHNVAAGGGVSGYNVDADAGAGAPHGQFGYMSNPALNQQLANFPGPNDMGGAFNPFLYSTPGTTYMNDPFLYATQAQPAEEAYPQHHMLAAPSQSTYQQQLRELNPNHLDDYDDRDSSIQKRKRPEKVRTAKPLTIEELEHDNSRFARVVKALYSIEDHTKRTVPEIAKAVHDAYPGRYADFEAVKRMVNDVLQKHKAFYHNGRGSPYYLNLEEGRARKEFPSTRNARSARHEFDEENVPPRMGYGRRSTRASRRNRAHFYKPGNEDSNMFPYDYMNSPIGRDDGHIHHEQQYFR
ncbi:hypothetical protein SCHPADRAFT_260806 [Schizopora paradoxa]|uniref:Uncharacterized protein n=1 Tax=Schizopora paradoxa TaxID=27342 RepID=A0A0H2SES1_9AGAM|nr:hypothetical protein SCHPADRAFT_260806 [Schizopora paradoxa]